MIIKRTTSGTQSIEILDRVLDKGIVIDAEYRYSLLGMGLCNIDAHGVVASIDTYLTHAGPIAAVRSVRRPALGAGPAAVVSITQRRRRRPWRRKSVGAVRQELGVKEHDSVRLRLVRQD
jgi:gas vesicle structural protein